MALNRLVLVPLLLAPLALSGCPEVFPTELFAGRPRTQSSIVPYQGPIIEAFDASPLKLAGKDDRLTLTVVATDTAGAALTYTWSATTGTLSSSSGTKVTWQPARENGTVSAGQGKITVTVSNGREAASSSVFLLVAEDGATTVMMPGRIPTVQRSPAPVGSVGGGTASPAPSGSPLACAVGALSPSMAAPGTLFYIDGQGLSEPITVTISDRPATVAAVEPGRIGSAGSRIAVQVPPAMAASTQVRPVSVTACGETKVVDGLLWVANMAEFNGDVRSVGAGLRAAVHALDRDDQELPEDLAGRKPVATFLANEIDMPPRAGSLGFWTGEGDVIENYAIQYTGELKVTTRGATRFSLVSAGGAKLFIDDRLVIDDGTAHGTRTSDGTVELSEGPHKLRVDYMNAGGVRALQLYWQPPGAFLEELVPPQALSTK